MGRSALNLVSFRNKYPECFHQITIHCSFTEDIPVINCPKVFCTKKKFLNWSDLAVIGLKHWLLLHTDFSTMFFFTKSSNCFAQMVCLGLWALKKCSILIADMCPFTTLYMTWTSASVGVVSILMMAGLGLTACWWHIHLGGTCSLLWCIWLQIFGFSPVCQCHSWGRGPRQHSHTPTSSGLERGRHSSCRAAGSDISSFWGSQE